MSQYPRYLVKAFDPDSGALISERNYMSKGKAESEAERVRFQYDYRTTVLDLLTPVGRGFKTVCEFEV